MKVRKQYGEMFLLPSAFTLANLFFGFLSVVYSLHGRYAGAAAWIMVAAILDALDGVLARSTRTLSEFGRQLDSLADSVSFGCAGALLLYSWGLGPVRPSGLFFSFIFLAAGILRLARYNLRSKVQPDRRYYQGHTLPSSMMLFVAIVLLHPQPLRTGVEAALLAALIVFVSFCMVSTIPYRNWLSFNLRHRIDIKTAFFLAVVIMALIFYARYMILAFFVFSLFAGPAAALLKKAKASRNLEKEHEQSLC